MANNKGDDVRVNIENMKVCANCKYGYWDGGSACCSHPYKIHNPVSMSNRCAKDWEFDEKNYLERIVEC